MQNENEKKDIEIKYLKKLNKCAEDILLIDNPDNLTVLDQAKSAIRSMQLLSQGEYKKAYELAKTTIALEEAAGRVGVALPFDCRFVLIRCLYEFSMIDDALSEELSKSLETFAKFEPKYFSCSAIKLLRVVCCGLRISL